MPESVQFPVACPTCQNKSGQAASIDGLVRSGAMTIWMRCGYCNHEWRHTLTVEISTHGSGRFPSAKP